MPEIIPKRRRPPITSTILFAFSIIALILVVGAYFVLDIAHQNKQAELEELQGQVSDLQKSTKDIVEKRHIVEKQKRIKDFQSLMKDHKYPLNLFEWLQKNTYPKVTWTRVNTSISDSQLTLAGKTESFNLVAYQIYLLNQNSYTKEAELAGISLGAQDEVKFNINLDLLPKLFNFNEF